MELILNSLPGIINFEGLLYSLYIRKSEKNYILYFQCLFCNDVIFLTSHVSFPEALKLLSQKLTDNCIID